MTKSHLKTILKVIVSISILVFISIKVDFQQVFKNLKSANLFYFISAVCFVQITFLLQSKRWRNSFDPDGTSKVKITELYKVTLIGHLFNNFLPGTFGGDIIKATKVGKFIGNTQRASTSLISNRLQGVFVLASLSFVALSTHYFFYKNTELFQLALYPIIILTLIPISIYLLSFFKFKNEKIKSIIFDLTKPSAYFSGVGLTFSIQLSLMITEFFIYRSIVGDFNFLLIIIGVPLIYLTTMIPISIGGIGLREASSITIFSILGYSNDIILSIVSLSYLLSIVNSFIGYYFFVIEKRKNG